jgi:hypothetical protein
VGTFTFFRWMMIIRGNFSVSHTENRTCIFIFFAQNWLMHGESKRAKYKTVQPDVGYIVSLNILTEITQ